MQLRKPYLEQQEYLLSISVYDTQTLKVLVGSEFGRPSFLFLLINIYCIQ